MSAARGKPAPRRAKAAPSARPTRSAPKKAAAQVKKPRDAKAPAPPVRPKPARAEKTAPPPAVRVPPRPVASSALSGVSSSGAIARSAVSALLRVGDDLPVLQRGPVTRLDIARYAGASGCWNPISLDEPYARSVNLPSVVVPGGLVLGLVSSAIGRWLRFDGHVARMGVRLAKMAWPGDVLTARARVSSIRALADARELDLDVWVENQKGELVLRGLATCRVTSPVAAEPSPPSAPVAAPSALPKPSRR